LHGGSFPAAAMQCAIFLSALRHRASIAH